MAEYDFIVEQGARELARRIVAYWASRGSKVVVRVEKADKVEGGRHEGAVWVVRSDLDLFVPRGTSAGQE
jgi:hypothetical protein